MKRTVSTYVKDRCIQMQLEMHCADKSRGILAIADHEFEKNFKITFITVQYNEQLVKMEMLRCTIFWYKSVYNKLKYAKCIYICIKLILIFDDAAIIRKLSIFVKP